MNLSQGHVIREPVGNRSGFWTGAPGVFYDQTEKTWYLTYRLRRPRGVQPDRGGEARIARSFDLKNWEDIWSVNKSEYKTASIERSALHRGPDKVWRYFTSFVNPADGKWAVAMLRGTVLNQLYTKNSELLFTAQSVNLEGVKDPWILHYQDLYYMFVSIALPTPTTSNKSHETQDIYNTGECISATGLAISKDLDHWQWKGVIFRPDTQGWDRYCRRINCVIPMDESFVAFYDGSASHAENYEEKTGIAVSQNLLRWKSVTETGPAHISPHGSHSLRYMDTQVQDSTAAIFYECSRPDAAHELRLWTTDRASFYATLGRVLPAEMRTT